MKVILSGSISAAIVLLATASVHSASLLIPPTPGDPYFEGFNPKPAPVPAGLVLKKGDRLAICGDSITEQKMYSRIMETYLTVCVPELEITARQYGWSGEQASGFLGRMTNDCLRFHPTIATTCYGMNDHRYRPYEDEIGATYLRYSKAIVEAFKANGVRVIEGSPGCVGKMPTWVKGTNGTVRDLNLNLCQLRNIDVDIARQERVGFADVFWPMFVSGFQAHQRYGTNFAIAGKDGVHPGWAGQLVMAYAFLNSFGLSGDIGQFAMKMGSGQAQASPGHRILSAQAGRIEITSSRYPFCATGPTNEDTSIPAGMSLVPFNQELNRLILRASGGKSKRYRVTWGNSSKYYTAAQLSDGINLAQDFPDNPFSEAFAKVEKAVLEKQKYETRQIKDVFHGLGRFKTADEIKDPELRRLYELRGENGKWDKDVLATETEKARAPLAEAIKTAFVPVTHVIQVDPE